MTPDNPTDGQLAQFPVDAMTLDMVEASLAYCLTIDKETGEPVPIDPEVVSLSSLLDFLSGTTTDPLGVVEHHGEVETFIGPAKLTVDPRPHYSQRDVIQALINEVRRLREELAYVLSLLAPDWLAAHDARVRAEALREAASMAIGCEHTGLGWCATCDERRDALLDSADHIENAATEVPEERFEVPRSAVRGEDGNYTVEILRGRQNGDEA